MIATYDQDHSYSLPQLTTLEFLKESGKPQARFIAKFGTIKTVRSKTPSHMHALNLHILHATGTNSKGQVTYNNTTFIQVASLASLASATFVCTLGREQQYILNATTEGRLLLLQAGFASHDQLSASLAPPSWRQRWVAAESLLLPETPWLEPPSGRRCWLAAESLSHLEIPWLKLVVCGRYLIVSHKFFACLSELLGVESASHQHSISACSILAVILNLIPNHS